MCTFGKRNWMEFHQFETNLYKANPIINRLIEPISGDGNCIPSRIPPEAYGQYVEEAFPEKPLLITEARRQDPCSTAYGGCTI